jgi:hypothetical protein
MNLSDVRVIMTIMHILVEELLCQAVTGQILLLESLLSGACGCLRLCPFKPDIKCRCFQRTRLQGNLPGTREPQAWPLGARVYAGLTGGKILPTRGYGDGGKD